MSRRKPTELKVLHGTQRADRQKNEPKPERVFPVKPPRHLKLPEYAKKFWKENAPRLDRLGLLTEADIDTFYTLAMLYNDMRDNEDAIKQDGATVPDGRGGVKKHPSYSVLNAVRQQFRLLAAEFGCTPASRGKLDLPGEQEEDELETMLKSTK